jgi:hypothetical protein
LYPVAATAPLGAYQTVTAVVTGVSDKTVTWTTDGGTIIGTNPCVVNEPCTVALYSETSGAFHLKATSNASNRVAGAATLTFTASPTPTTGHPRLMVTPGMLPGLRAKATAGNPLYQALVARANLYLDGDKMWSWSCDGATGQPSSDQSGGGKETDAQLFAFLSMVAPTQAERDRWACYGRDVWVYVMNQAVNGKTSLHGGNQWSDSSAAFSLTTDWLMAGNYLSAADLSLARRFLGWAAQNALSLAYGFTAPVGGYNSPAQFDTGSIWDLTSVRAMGNNYTLSKMLYVVAAALTFDDNTTDDPPLSNSCIADRSTVCPDFSAGSLHAYWNYFVGGMLYLSYAHFEDPAVSWAAYQARFANLPSQPTCQSSDGARHFCFGDGRGGESSEGSWYSYSLYRLRYALNAIHTAGYDDPMKYGPQLSLSTSSWWDMHYVSEIEFLTGRVSNSGAFNYWTTGDSNSYVRYPSDYATLSATITADSYSGGTDRQQALLWPILNTAFGGPTGNEAGCRSYCGFISELSNDYGNGVAVDLFISLPAGDPTSTLPPDPRPGLPPDLYSGNNQHILARTGWTNNDVGFSYYCPPALIDHEHAFCGRFDIFSRGEYITKGRTEFTDYNNAMSTAPQSNLAAIINMTGSSCNSSNCLVYDACLSGGQVWHGEQAGFADVLHAELPSYVAALVDTTNFYNTSSVEAFPGYNDVAHASRSLVYLRGTNQVVYYDRADTGHAASKSVHLVTTGAVSITSNTATWLTRSGQQRAFVTSLLPETAVVSDAGLAAGGSDQQDDWEPYSTVMIDGGSPTTARFLTVLEFGAAALKKSTTRRVQSTNGTSFDGALVGTSLVMFKSNWSDSLQTVTYPASGATRHYVADLRPNHAYSVTKDGATASVNSDTAGVVVFDALGTGNVSVLDAGG